MSLGILLFLFGGVPPLLAALAHVVDLVLQPFVRALEILVFSLPGIPALAKAPRQIPLWALEFTEKRGVCRVIHDYSLDQVLHALQAELGSSLLAPQKQPNDTRAIRLVKSEFASGQGDPLWVSLHGRQSE